MLETVQAEWAGADGKPSLELTCESGELDLETNDLVATGNVHGLLADGRRFVGPSLRYDRARGVAYTDAPVEIIEEGRVLSGGGFEYHVRDRRLRFTRRCASPGEQHALTRRRWIWLAGLGAWLLALPAHEGVAAEPNGSSAAAVSPKQPETGAAGATASAAPAAAEAEQRVSMFPIKGDKPLSIRSDELEALENEGRRRLLFTSNVHIEQGDLLVNSDRLEAFYPPGGSQPDKLVASGHVEVKQLAAPDALRHGDLLPDRGSPALRRRRRTAAGRRPRPRQARSRSSSSRTA